MTQLLDAVSEGSYLLLSHPTAQVHREAMLDYTRLPAGADQGGLDIGQRGVRVAASGGLLG